MFSGFNTYWFSIFTNISWNKSYCTVFIDIFKNGNHVHDLFKRRTESKCIAIMFISKYFWNFQIIRIIIFELTGIWLQDSNTPFASMSASDHDIPFCNMPKIVFAPFLALVQNPIENLPTLFKLINLLHLGFTLAWVSAKIQPGRTYVCFRSPTHKTTVFNAIYINHRNTASISIIVLGWLALEAHRMSRWLNQKKASVLKSQKTCKY